MDKKWTIAILVVVVIVIVAACAVALTGDDDDDKKDTPDTPVTPDTPTDVEIKTTDYGGTLQLFGNANMDSVIDAEDAKYIQQYLNGKVEKTDFCDANNDGVIDSKDVSYVNDLINYKSGTVAYYLDGNDKVAKANVPLTTVVVYGSSSCQLLCLALGMDSSNVIQYDTWPSTSADNVDLVFQKFKGAATVTSGNISDFSSVVKDGTPSAVIVSDYTISSLTDSSVLDLYEKAGIAVVSTKGFDGAGVADSELTLGYLFNRSAQAQKFATWCDSMLTEISEKIKTLKESDYPTALYWFGGQAVAGMNSTWGNVLLQVGAKNAADWTETYRVLNADNQDWILNYDVDYILRTISQGLGYGCTDQSRTAVYNNYAKLVSETNAYKEGHFVLIDGNMPQILRMAYMAEFMHPDLFGTGFGDKYNQQLVDLYGIDYDVSKHVFMTTTANLVSS